MARPMNSDSAPGSRSRVAKRDSPSGDQLGADVVYHDRYVPSVASLGLESSTLEDALTGADLAVIVTAHPDIDYRGVAERLPVVDLRGVLRDRHASAQPARRLSPVSISTADAA